MSRAAHAFAAWGLAAGLLVALWAGVVAPLADRRAALEGDVATALTQRDRFLAALAEGTGRAEAPPPLDALLPARGAALATAALQGLLDDAIRRVGGERDSAQGGEPRREGPALVVSVTLDARLTAAQLMRALHALETGAPVVLVEAVEVRRVEAVEAADEGAEPALAVRLRAAAFAEPEIAATGGADGT